MAIRYRRKEPSFGDQPKRRNGLRADPEDRIGGRRARVGRPGLLAGLLGRSSASGKKKRKNSVDDAGETASRRKQRRNNRTRRRRSLFGGLLYWSCVACIWGLIGVTGIVAFYAGKLPPIDKLAVPKRPPNIAILAADGTLLANRGDTGGPAIQLRELPGYLPKAFVAIEDRRFYSHWGIDVKGIARAMYANLTRDKGGMQGGSTLTQQLAKNLFLTQERTISRKIQEAILSVWLERKYSKDQILQLYLNRVYFGAGAYGVEAASQRYFGVSARNVTLAQAAMLAGLMKAPTRYAPNRNPAAAEARASIVLTAMAQEGHITESVAKIALSNPAKARQNLGSDSTNYVADFVMDRLNRILGAFDHDLVVETTIDPIAQRQAERALVLHLNKSGKRYRVSQGAIVAMEPGGGIRALVGGRDYAKSQFNRAVAARRQPGSAFKPFVFLTALERGLHPESRRLDGPVNIRGWRPENASHKYYGNVTLTRALALSLNTVAVRLAMELGPARVAKTARRLGIRSKLRNNASLALGTSEVNLLEMTGAYAVFANGGIAVEPYVIKRVRRARGKRRSKIVFRHRYHAGGRVVSPRNVAMINAMMQETLLTGTARKAELPGWQAAGKTGTTQDYKDAWFIGYTSRLVTGVWLGNDNSAPTRKVSGGNLPVRIWSRFMTRALARLQPDRLPSGNWRDPRAIGLAPPVPPALIPGSAPVKPAFTARPARTSGTPMTINPVGRAHDRRAIAPARARQGNPLMPPAAIGRGTTGSIPAKDRSLLQRMFGG